MESEKKRKEIYEWRTCIEADCGRRFFISKEEKEYFDSKFTDIGRKFEMPKRCYQCRVKRRKSYA